MDEHSSSYTMTMVIENRAGDSVDVDQARAALESLGLKLSAWGHGDHLLAQGAVRLACEHLDSARRLVGSALDEPEEDPDATP